METKAAPSCPKCGTAVEPTWDWCHSCGYDPEGKRLQQLRQQAADPSPATSSDDGGGVNKLAVAAAIVVGMIVVVVGGYFIMGDDPVVPEYQAGPPVETTSTVLGSPPEGWARHETYGLSADFPGVPEPLHDAGDGVEMNGLLYEGEHFTYVAQVNEYSQQLPEFGVAREVVLQLLGNHFGINMYGGDNTTIAGMDALRMKVKEAPGYYELEGELVVAFDGGRRLYVLIAFGPNVPNDAERFFSSFVPA